MELVSYTSPVSIGRGVLEDLDIYSFSYIYLPGKNNEDVWQWFAKHLTYDRNELQRRYSVLQAFLTCPSSKDTISELLKAAEIMEHCIKMLSIERGRLLYCNHVIRLLNKYVESVHKLCDFFSRFREGALADIKEYVESILDSQDFQGLEKHLDSISALYRPLRNVTAGVNVYQNCDAYQLGILGINNDGGCDTGLLDSEKKATGLFREIPIKKRGEFVALEHYMLKQVEREWGVRLFRIYRELKSIGLEQVYSWLEFIRPMEFYLAGLTFAQTLEKKGYCLCVPSSEGEDICSKNLVYPHLAFVSDRSTVCSSTAIPGAGAAFVTGANHSGKTSYLKAVAQSCLLAQLGFLLPAEQFSFTPREKYFTFFSAGEDDEMQSSRFQQEAEKVKDIISLADESSLVFFNEPFTSTNPKEAVQILCDVISELLAKRATQIVVTHLYDAYYLLKGKGTQRIASFVTGARLSQDGSEVLYSYEIMRKEPNYQGYASIIARQFGVNAASLLDGSKAAAVNEYLKGDCGYGLDA